MTGMKAIGAAVLAAGLMAGMTGARAQGGASATVDAVTKRGLLVCGVSTGAAGFSLADSQGVIRGLDADGCRAVAAVVLGDANKVRFVPTTTTNRFTALQSGEVDLLIRSTTWTLGREANLGLLFADVNYYDGTGFLVKASAGVKAAKDMDGATVCVQPGTSTELAINDYFRVNKMKFSPILIQDLNEIQNAFLSGRCDAYSTDGSALAAFRFQQGDKAKDFVLLPDIISKEPLGALGAQGRRQAWFDRSSAMDPLCPRSPPRNYGVTQARTWTRSFLISTNPGIRRLLGVEGSYGRGARPGPTIGPSSHHQGRSATYGEIFERNVTPGLADQDCRAA